MASKIYTHAVLLGSCLLTIFPLLWMVSTSLKAPDDIFTATLSLIPTRPTLNNYAAAWGMVPLGKYLRNSAVTSVLIMGSQLVTSLLAAYGFSRFRFRGREILFGLFLGTMIVPIHVVMIPNYILVTRLGWLDTWAALIIPQLSSAFGVFMLRQHLLSIPNDLFDAAAIDGAGNWRTLWQIVVPIMRPSLSALAVLFFLNAWNQYFWPFLVLTRPEVQTIPLGLQRFASGEAGMAWGPLMAVATTASLPALAVYIVAQRHIISSFVTSGLKG
jgi:sn-glycerol 3-phosphate transport system permease protein